MGRSASLLGLLGLVFFSFGLMNRSIDRWFSQPVSELREDSTRIALELSHYVTQNARAAIFLFPGRIQPPLAGSSFMAQV